METTKLALPCTMVLVLLVAVAAAPPASHTRPKAMSRMLLQEGTSPPSPSPAPDASNTTNTTSPSTSPADPTSSSTAATPTAPTATPTATESTTSAEPAPAPAPTADLCTVRCFDGRTFRIDCAKKDAPENSRAAKCGDETSAGLMMAQEP